MIRLILGFSGLFLLWLWLISPFSKRAKTIITMVAVALSIALALYESYDNKPRTGLIAPNDINVCELQVKHNYRTDYKVQLCVENTSSKIVKRLAFLVTAKQCNEGGECEVLEAVSHDIPITINPGNEHRLSETISFELVAASDSTPKNSNTLDWSVDITSVKAIP